MAFLDNSGDIILDAVLTDTGRLRLAQGDGSFRITKFALGDDEINYGLYNKDHLSGSAYYDLEVLQTPVLEAFTNNTSNLKSKLVTISRTNILYMPVLKLNKNRGQNPNFQHASSKTFFRPGNTGTPAAVTSAGGADRIDNRFYVAVDRDTYLALSRFRDNGTSTPHKQFTGTNTLEGVIQGFIPGSAATTTVEAAYDLIRVDQGLDTTQIAPSIGMDSDLLETAFIVEMDYRLGRVKQL